jgi:hypothetical protein
LAELADTGKQVQINAHMEERDSNFGGTFTSTFFVVDVVKEYDKNKKGKQTFRRKETDSIARNAKRLSDDTEQY